MEEKKMDQVSTLERIFSYKAKANDEMLAAVRQFDDASGAREIVLRVLNHIYAVDQIFAANLRRAEHGYTSPNPSRAPALEELSEAIRTGDRWYIDYVSRIDETELAECIDFTFTDGEPGRMSREEMLMHVSVHGEYHRGQLSVIMMQNSITPPGDGFTTYLHKTEAPTRRRAPAQ
ncbi:MAG TPA: DinB family protein [Candidatus Binataceae bacterium]|nr:DinB family protein [Candidatus Binataceae bacterium]